MKILPVGAELFRTDGQTDMTKLIVAFRNFANAPKEEVHDLKYLTLSACEIFLLFELFVLWFVRNKLYREMAVCGAMSVMSVVRRVFDRYPCIIYRN